MALLAFLSAFATAVVPSTITVYAWPFSSSSPKPFAEIILPSTSGGVPDVRSKTIPSAKAGELVRIGLLDSSKSWSGVATTADSFLPGIAHKISLHTDSDGEITHLSFSSFKAESPQKGKKIEDMIVEVVPIQPGPQPVLNKPVVLNAEGKVDTPGQGDNKTFLQK